ncbi:uroporphyrinogen-III C-methyltransferase [Hydrogenophaga sp.]|jgi:uroporphyrin-III C-methyltransferase|uniref:uroporphyrinogen-III C-methyltransferase n=1 Tax=Hydrogenophaga sp. TaxID=1904254 RepID=UPI00272FC9FF|nr:uroporphyrinogen-III C-methyltransferase [Hydrogenophaga sp.]MDP2405448.1 uroporphyrinogen-III C-methyltransferase [Hydrogenophaga sp.]MDP3886274.1 uroporphyrinogen-III C-methyltransferase [Hydrogenophaga sp.]MDZ4177161.1 uroporphyrinogen-III C-methyltransferase [Hydrogenophaga sp.]
MSVMEHSHWLAPGWPGDGTATDNRPPGLVTLVGAGPGDPELLTLKAVKALQAAKLVLYDHLVSPAVLDFLPPGADRVYVGKESSRHTLPQASIIELMLRLARSGRAVLRLKGGDGYIFGRGGEEAQALAAAGIPFTVVPGLTAAQGAAASVGIPLTHRDHACSLVLTTGHLRDNRGLDIDWALLARPRQTVVLYMGVNNLSEICRQLIAHGLPGDTPAALVEKATLPDERCITGTLADLPELALSHGVKPPALIMVGGVVGLRAQLMPGAALARIPRESEAAQA